MRNFRIVASSLRIVALERVCLVVLACENRAAKNTSNPGKAGSTAHKKQSKQRLVCHQLSKLDLVTVNNYSAGSLIRLKLF